MTAGGLEAILDAALVPDTLCSLRVDLEHAAQTREQELAALHTFASKTTSLTALSLPRYLAATPDTLVLALDAARQCQSLRHLTACRLDSGATARVVEFVAEETRIERLCVLQQHEQLCLSLFAPALDTLACLEVESPCFSSACSAATFCARLQRQSRLTELALTDGALIDRDVVLLCRALCGSATLRSLDLSSNEFQLGGVRAIVELLHASTTLQQLRIGSQLPLSCLLALE